MSHPLRKVPDMTQHEITKTATGSVVSYEESPAERAQRISAAAADAAQRVRVTAGQRRVLARVQDRARREAAAS